MLSASDPLPEPQRQPQPVAARPAAKKKKKKDPAVPPPPPPSAALGGTLFRSVGCLACHRAGELGSDGLFGGGDLSLVASKRPADFFARWLAEPGRINRDHRMPLFPLDADEIESLCLYLQTLGEPAADAAANASPADVSIGARLIRAAGCAACHALPASLATDSQRPPTPIRPASFDRASETCLGEPAADQARPGYRLDDEARRAVKTFVRGISRVPQAPPVRSGHDLLIEQNCLGCHARGWSRGIADRLLAVAEADGGLRDVLPALEPPALFGIGDKLHDEALLAALDAPVPARRPWLKVRMPKFPLTPEQSRTLVEYFVTADRIPARPALEPSEPDVPATALDAAGPRLVTADGFGCTSCHAIGDWTPTKVALNAQGAALSQVGRRVRREWFDRWVRNPARIVPKMEMPSVQQSIRGVLAGNLDAQLTAVWRVLNRPDFTPPSPSACASCAGPTSLSWPSRRPC